MRKLFLYLLKRYSRTEKDRLIILAELDNSIYEDYSEQTTFGNVYNYFTEFIMSNDFVKMLVKKNDTKSLSIVKSGINTSFTEAINFIKDEKL